MVAGTDILAHSELGHKAPPRKENSRLRSKKGGAVGRGSGALWEPHSPLGPQGLAVRPPLIPAARRYCCQNLRARPARSSLKIPAESKC